MNGDLHETDETTGKEGSSENAENGDTTEEHAVSSKKHRKRSRRKYHQSETQSHKCAIC